MICLDFKPATGKVEGGDIVATLVETRMARKRVMAYSLVIVRRSLTRRMADLTKSAWDVLLDLYEIENV